MANPDLVKQFGGKLLNICTGGVLTKLIEVGYQVGLFEASRDGPATSDELSERAGLKERYVREWLGDDQSLRDTPAEARCLLPRRRRHPLLGISPRV